MWTLAEQECPTFDEVTIAHPPAAPTDQETTLDEAKVEPPSSSGVWWVAIAKPSADQETTFGDGKVEPPGSS